MVAACGNSGRVGLGSVLFISLLLSAEGIPQSLKIDRQTEQESRFMLQRVADVASTTYIHT